MVCHKCGKKLQENEKFCTICGYYNSGEDDYDEVVGVEENDNLPGFSSILANNESTPQEQLIEVIDDTKNNNEEFKVDEKSISYNENQDEFFDYKDERLLESYIGEDYKVVKKMPVNFYALFLSWMYVLYRKMYLIGIIGLIITYLFVAFAIDYLIIYLAVSAVLLGFFFNKIYIFIATKKVKAITDKNKLEDNFTLENICKKKGGVNFIIALIIYAVFLIAVFFTKFTFSFNENHNSKFFTENSENKATCISLVKTAYNDFLKTNKPGTIEEAACKVDKPKKDSYKIILKLQNNNPVYLYYETEGDYLKLKKSTESINELELKNANQTITEVEKTYLTELKEVENTYFQINSKSKEEDNLIKNKKNTSEKINFIFTKEEVTR